MFRFPLRGRLFAALPVCPPAAQRPLAEPCPCGAAHSLRSRSVQLAAPLLGPSLGLAPTGPAHALFKIAPGNFVSNPGRRFSSPQGRAICEKKSPYFRTSSSLNMAVRGGIDSLCSPLRGSPFAMLPVCPTGCASSRTPVGASHPHLAMQHAKKKARTFVRALLKIWR